MGAVKHLEHLELIEGAKEIRDQYIKRLDVLDKVKKIISLPNTDYMTSDMLAEYYEVDQQVIQRIFLRHRQELNDDGVNVIKGEELKQFKIDVQPVHLKAKAHLTIIPRRAILRIGMLLTESEVAEKVRTYLLNVEESATEVQKSTSLLSWNEYIDNELLSIVKKSVLTGKNLGETLEEFAKSINATKGQVHNRWYNVVRKMCDENTLEAIKLNSVPKPNLKLVQQTNQSEIVKDVPNVTVPFTLTDIKTIFDETVLDLKSETEWDSKYMQVKKDLKITQVEVEKLEIENQLLKNTITLHQSSLDDKDKIIRVKNNRIKKLEDELKNLKQRVDAVGIILDVNNSYKATSRGYEISQPKQTFKMDRNGNLTKF